MAGVLMGMGFWSWQLPLLLLAVLLLPTGQAMPSHHKRIQQHVGDQSAPLVRRSLLGVSSKVNPWAPYGPDGAALLSLAAQWRKTSRTTSAFANWSMTKPCASWSGVVCSGRAKHVTGLTLVGSFLAGSIPADIGKLLSLEYLDIAYNGITGSLPSEIGALKSLTALVAFSNKFSGSLPAAIGDLAKLKYLHLGVNQISGSLPSHIGALKSLTKLNIGNNSLSGSLPWTVGSLVQLQYLQLSYNNLCGFLPKTMSSLAKLEYLALHDNQLSGGVSMLAPLINRGTLYFLGYNNYFTGRSEYCTNFNVGLSNNCMSPCDPGLLADQRPAIECKRFCGFPQQCSGKGYCCSVGAKKVPTCTCQRGWVTNPKVLSQCVMKGL